MSEPGISIPWRRSTDPKSPTFEPTVMLAMDGKPYYVPLKVYRHIASLEAALSAVEPYMDDLLPHVAAEVRAALGISPPSERTPNGRD